MDDAKLIEGTSNKSWRKSTNPILRQIFKIVVLISIAASICAYNWLSPRYSFEFQQVILDPCCDGTKNICDRQNCTETCPLKPRAPSIHKSNKNAFFWETAGRKSLSVRQACSVESLARLNPHLKVYILMTAEVIDSRAETMKSLIQYGNIYPIKVNLDDFMAQTPLERWYFCTDWQTGEFNVSHLSDGLRFLTLSQYGGYYFDLDFIFSKSLFNHTNFVAAESEALIGSSALHFDHENQFIHEAVAEFKDNYRKDAFIHNGPGLLTRLLVKWCKTENITSMYSSGLCSGIRVYTPNSFFSIYYPSWRKIFEERTLNDVPVAELVKDAFGVHLWNKLSFNETVYKNSSQLYTLMARSFCPKVFSTAPDMF